MANYPSTITAFTNPSPTDKLSTTPHSSIESAQNTDLTAIETFVGTLSSNVGTLVYDIRAAASNGGGHVQLANVGGTGQTAYTKGDILVATSSSVLTKLAVSANDNDFLAVNSSVAAGINWKAGVTSGQVQNQAASYSEDSGSGSVYAIYPNPCVLSYAGGQVFSFRAGNTNTVTTPALAVSSLVAQPIKNSDGTSIPPGGIVSSQMTTVQYNGSQSYFALISESPLVKGAEIAKVVDWTSSSTSVTGTVSVKSLLLSANDMTANSRLKIFGYVTNTETSGSVQVLFGDAPLYTGLDSTYAPAGFEMMIGNRNSTSSQYVFTKTFNNAANTPVSSQIFYNQTTASINTANSVLVSLRTVGGTNGNINVQAWEVSLLK